MGNKKMFFYFKFLVLFFCGGLLSCSFFKDVPAPSGNLGGEANFIVSEIEGKVVETKANGLPEEIRIAYKACFKDQSYQDNALQNSFFNVHFFESPPPSPDEDTQKCGEGEEFVFQNPSKKKSSVPRCLRIRTDASGCFNWTEIYPVKSFHQSRWLAYERGFEGTGLYHGMRSIPLAVNPWLSLDPSGSESSLQLMDSRYHKIGENLKADSTATLSASQGAAAPSSSEEEVLLGQLTYRDIKGCEKCRKNKPPSSVCQACEYKTKSLSRVMNKYFNGQKPRLWLNHLSSNINQEHINLQNPTVLHQRILKQFQVCYQGQIQNCDPAGRFFKVQLEMPLRIKVKNFQGETNLLPLKRGRYSVDARLYLSGDKGQKQWQLHRDLSGVLASPAAGSEESHFRSVFYLHLPYEHYGLAASLSLNIKSEEDKFKQFEGVFHFPEFLSTVRGKNSLNLAKRVEDFYENPLNQDKSFILSEMNMSSALLDQPVLREQLGFRSAGWDVQLKRLRFSDILMEEGKCPTPVSRHIRYVGEACVVDPLTGEPVSNTQIKILRQDVEFLKGEKGAVVDSQGKNILPPSSLKWSHFVEGVDESYIHHPSSQKNSSSFSPSDQKIQGPHHWSNTQGCVQWVDTMEHQWYDRERYFVRRMVFSKEEWGFEGEKIIAINPWHYGFVFFQDITQLGLSSVRTRTEHVEKPQLALHDFRSLFVEPVYTVDNSLGIHIFQNLLFLFRVMVQRPDDVATGQGGKRPSARPLRRGYYLLRFILMKSHTDEDGGAGNQVHHHGEFVQQYANSLNLRWNELNRGWTLGKQTPARTGQMMNTTFDYITHFDTYVQVRDGTVNAYINFLFDMEQFAFIGSNSRVIVELLPTDPEHYVYKEGSCEVDPQASRFVPLKRTKHDLISKPFFGSFVPKDLRNWNIFRVVDTEESKMYQSMPFLSLDHEGTDELIAKSREQLKGKKEFLKSFHRGLNVSVSGWSPFSQVQIQQESVARQWESLYRQMWAFQKSFKLLKGGKRDVRFVLHHQKNKLTELIDKTSQFMDEVISRGAYQGKTGEKDFFRTHRFLKQLRKEMDSEEMSFESMQAATQNLRDLLGRFLPVKSISSPGKRGKPFSPVDFLNPDTSEEKDSLKRVCAEGAEGKNLNSTKRLCEFSAHEALKPVLMDSEEDKNKFLEDLGEIARKYRDYRSKYIPFAPAATEESFPPLFSQKQKAEWIQKAPLQNAEERQHFVSEIENHQKVWENHFPLYRDDNELNFTIKNSRVHLFPLSEEEINQVIAGGVHKGNIDTHEVSQFLHLMCGFWFDKFYDEYLDFRQIQTISNKHKDHLNYYLGTGEQWLKSYARDILNGKSAGEASLSPVDYGNLLSVMKAQGLTPYEVRGLKPTNPFYYPEISKLGGVMEFAYSHVNRYRPMGLFPSLLQTPHAYRHPYFKCFNNPLRFFHIEKKVIVGDIGTGYSDLKYNYGESRRLAMQTSFDFSYALNWSMSKSFSASLGSGFTFLGDLNPLKLINPFFTWNGVKLGGDWSSGASTQESSRRQQTLRFAQPIELAVSHSSVSIRLKEFRHCLVIRPQNLSFQEYQGRHHIFKPEYKDNVAAQLPYIKSGLLLCSPSQGKNQRDQDFSIVEDYFYIYQPAQGDPSEFLRHLSMRNRPYILTVRGVTDYEKLMFLMRSFVEADQEEGIEDSHPEAPMTSQWKKNSRVFDGTRRAIRQAKLWDKTGFYPGVYHVRPDNEHFYFKSPVIPQSRGGLKTLGEYMYKNNILPWVPFDSQESVLE